MDRDDRCRDRDERRQPSGERRKLYVRGTPVGPSARGGRPPTRRRPRANSPRQSKRKGMVRPSAETTSRHRYPFCPHRLERCSRMRGPCYVALHQCSWARTHRSAFSPADQTTSFVFRGPKLPSSRPSSCISCNTLTVNGRAGRTPWRDFNPRIDSQGYASASSHCMRTTYTQTFTSLGDPCRTRPTA